MSGGVLYMTYIIAQLHKSPSMKTWDRISIPPNRTGQEALVQHRRVAQGGCPASLAVFKGAGLTFLVPPGWTEGIRLTN